MSTPHKCPICGGRGLVSQNFYQLGGWSGTSVGQVTCRSCGGCGIVWQPVAVTTYNPVMFDTSLFISDQLFPEASHGRDKGRKEVKKPKKAREA